MFFNVDVIMDMLGNSKWRGAILQYYENSGDPQNVFEVIKSSQEENTDGGNDGFAYMLFGKKRCVSGLQHCCSSESIDLVTQQHL